ncbi:hypothetical protein F5Y05DRAFT_392914 [Hypoxylon sp. FL0543]|nr:hypothetical protein F5Y05DRAFT_392914 [Hypoxylon sp. FL0543]
MPGDLPGPSKEKLRGDFDKGETSRESQKRQSTESPPQYEEAAGDNATENELRPPCVHWEEADCLLHASSRKCCACMDQRPRSEYGKYPMYVDGDGWVTKGTRWQYYCHNCKGISK